MVPKSFCSFSNQLNGLFIDVGCYLSDLLTKSLSLFFRVLPFGCYLLFFLMVMVDSFDNCIFGIFLNMFDFLAHFLVGYLRFFYDFLLFSLFILLFGIFNFFVDIFCNFLHCHFDFLSFLLKLLLDGLLFQSKSNNSLVYQFLGLLFGGCGQLLSFFSKSRLLRLYFFSSFDNLVSDGLSGLLDPLGDVFFHFGCQFFRLIDNFLQILSHILFSFLD